MLLLFVSAELPPELAEARADTAMAKALLVLIPPPPPLLFPEMQSRLGQSLINFPGSVTDSPKSVRLMSPRSS